MLGGQIKINVVYLKVNIDGGAVVIHFICVGEKNKEVGGDFDIKAKDQRFPNTPTDTRDVFLLAALLTFFSFRSLKSIYLLPQNSHP